MEGLAKLAWTNRKIQQAGQRYLELRKALAAKEKVHPEELQSILKHIGEDRNIDIEGYLYDNTQYRGPAFYASPEYIEQERKALSQKDPSQLTKIEKIILEDYEGAKDGLVLSPKGRTTLTHELGHAIDRSENRKLYDQDDIANAVSKAAPKITGTIGALGSYGGYQLSDDHSALTGALAGGLVGGGLGHLATKGANNILLRTENAANNYGDEIIKHVHEPETAEKLLRQSKPLREAALQTYKLNNLRNLKNTYIGAGLGTGIGLGLGYLGDHVNINVTDDTAE